MCKTLKFSNLKRVGGFLLLYMLALKEFPNVVNIASCNYGNLIVFEITAYLGILFLVYFSGSLCGSTKFKNIINPVEWIGRNTLVIFALHQPLVRIFRYLGERMFVNFPIQSNLIVAIVTDIIIILCLIPVVFVYKWFNKRYLSKLYLR